MIARQLHQVLRGGLHVPPVIVMMVVTTRPGPGYCDYHNVCLKSDVSVATNDSAPCPQQITETIGS